MMDEMECMCLNCGISSYLSRDLISLDDPSHADVKLLRNCWCQECGGALILVGKAGDRPSYRLE
jgi:hypothetical protein